MNPAPKINTPTLIARGSPSTKSPGAITQQENMPPIRHIIWKMRWRTSLSVEARGMGGGSFHTEDHSVLSLIIRCGLAKAQSIPPAQAVQR